MRISDWSSDVCSSDLLRTARRDTAHADVAKAGHGGRAHRTTVVRDRRRISWRGCGRAACSVMCDRQCFDAGGGSVCFAAHRAFDQPGAEQWRYPEVRRSEEHTSELQSLMRISYAVFCLKKNKHEH